MVCGMERRKGMELFWTDSILNHKAGQLSGEYGPSLQMPGPALSGLWGPLRCLLLAPETGSTRDLNPHWVPPPSSD